MQSIVRTPQKLYIILTLISKAFNLTNHKVLVNKIFKKNSVLIIVLYVLLIFNLYVKHLSRLEE